MCGLVRVGGWSVRLQGSACLRFSTRRVVRFSRERHTIDVLHHPSTTPKHTLPPPNTQTHNSIRIDSQPGILGADLLLHHRVLARLLGLPHPALVASYCLLPVGWDGRFG